WTPSQPSSWPSCPMTGWPAAAPRGGVWTRPPAPGAARASPPPAPRWPRPPPGGPQPDRIEARPP
ncbi:MAG: hypothetical protein AVDCRST_MAG76-3270, partial [uncultured Acidimicrobiales bacterium]